MRQAGFTLVELLIALTIAGSLASLGWSGLRQVRDAAALEGAARSALRQLSLGRRLAVSRRETIRLREDEGGLGLFDSRGQRITRLDLGPEGELPIDSLTVRPSSIRFNARGHAGAGSVYLWKGRKGVRLVCNFLGRIRREPVSGAS